jgi:molybdopterin/thiamine biosynthesis adenylyltransferase
VPGSAVLVGVGGIGAYLATLLAALGWAAHLVDSDVVEESNLNRQGLFTPADAHGSAPKALAARDALSRLFPGARLTAEVRRVGPDYHGELAGLRPRPVVLSAVDNARSRLVLQGLGRELGLTVVQGGTGTHAADVYVQAPGGPLLDEQLHGALATAAAREDLRDRAGGCAVEPALVAPGMMAAALMARRLLGHAAGQALPPLHWRSGGLVVEARRSGDGSTSRP